LEISLKLDKFQFWLKLDNNGHYMTKLNNNAVNVLSVKKI
jgi:hypothetical protein